MVDSVNTPLSSSETLTSEVALAVDDLNVFNAEPGLVLRPCDNAKRLLPRCVIDVVLPDAPEQSHAGPSELAVPIAVMVARHFVRMAADSAFTVLLELGLCRMRPSRCAVLTDDPIEQQHVVAFIVSRLIWHLLPAERVEPKQASPL